MPVRAASSGIFAVLAACEGTPGEAANSKRQSGFIIPEMNKENQKQRRRGGRGTDSVTPMEGGAFEGRTADLSLCSELVTLIFPDGLWPESSE